MCVCTWIWNWAQGISGKLSLSLRTDSLANGKYSSSLYSPLHQHPRLITVSHTVARCAHTHTHTHTFTVSLLLDCALKDYYRDPLHVTEQAELSHFDLEDLETESLRN